MRGLKRERLWILAGMMFIALSTIYSLIVAIFLPWIAQYFGWDLVLLGLLIAGVALVERYRP